MFARPISVDVSWVEDIYPVSDRPTFVLVKSIEAAVCTMDDFIDITVDTRQEEDI
jgi:hypothetical protein